MQNGNLYCSLEHDAQKEDGSRTAAKELIAAGFAQDATALNIYRKDGVAVTLERTLHVGLDEAIRQHGHVRVAGPTQGKPGDASAPSKGSEGVAGAKS